MKLVLILALPLLTVAQLRGPATQSGQGGGLRDCVCPAVAPAPCPSASLCECENQAIISCWAQWSGRCQISLKVCPITPGGNFGASPAFSSEYPPCGQLLPACAPGKVCRKLDTGCDDSNRGATCMGLCIPAPTPKPKATPPPPFQPVPQTVPPKQPPPVPPKQPQQVPPKSPHVHGPKPGQSATPKEYPAHGGLGGPDLSAPAHPPASLNVTQPIPTDLPPWPAKGPRGKGKGGAPKVASPPKADWNHTQATGPL